MNKLVLLSEIRKEKDKLFDLNKKVKKESNKLYNNFKEKFNFFHNKDELVNCKKINNNNEKKLDIIMKRIFSIDNKGLLIALINSIFNDELSPKTKIEYINNLDNEVTILKDSNYSLKIQAEDDYRKFEYHIQFQTKDDENIGIILNKIDLTADYDNIVNFNSKRKELKINISDKSFDEKYKRCLIMLNSNIEVPDVYEIESGVENDNIERKINVIKSWKYDFKQLVEKNMYLLFPIKVLDLRQRILSLSQEIGLEYLIKDDIYRFFSDMNKYLKRIKEKKLITDKQINEINLISIDLLDSFIEDNNYILINIKNEIEATLKGIVV